MSVTKGTRDISSYRLRVVRTYFRLVAVVPQTANQCWSIPPVFNKLPSQPVATLQVQVVPENSYRQLLTFTKSRPVIKTPLPCFSGGARYGCAPPIVRGQAGLREWHNGNPCHHVHDCLIESFSDSYSGGREAMQDHICGSQRRCAKEKAPNSEGVYVPGFGSRHDDINRQLLHDPNSALARPRLTE